MFLIPYLKLSSCLSSVNKRAVPAPKLVYTTDIWININKFHRVKPSMTNKYSHARLLSLLPSRRRQNVSPKCWNLPKPTTVSHIRFNSQHQQFTEFLVSENRHRQCSMQQTSKKVHSFDMSLPPSSLSLSLSFSLPLLDLVLKKVEIEVRTFRWFCTVR